MAGRQDSRYSWLVLAAFAFLHLTLTLAFTLSAPFPIGVDGLQHLSFIAHMDRFPGLTPDYANIFV